MKFRNFGKALLMSALSAGLVLSVTSCVQSYTVGFLYVTGLQTSGGTSSHGIISGYKIDHNTGMLRPINGLPISSGGANPIRASLLTGSRFLYVLNQGTDASGGNNCTSQTAPCKASIVQFSVSGNGSLLQQETFYPQGLNSFRMIVDAAGGHLFVLDRQAPDSGVGTSNSCSLALGSGVTTCGDVTVFNIDSTTGRLSLIQNAQVASASGAPLTYFPVPVNPIDFALSGSYLLSLSGTAATGDFVFPYAFNGGNGQLTVSQNSAQPINAFHATALVSNSVGVYVLTNDPLTYTSSGNTVTASAQILPFTVGSNGSLTAQSSGAVPDDPSLSNPQFMLLEERLSNWMYVANTGNNSSTTNPQSGLAGYTVQKDTKQLTFLSTSPFGTGAGPQCLVEDPSKQFIYTANYNDSTVSGRLIDANTGALKALPGTAAKNFSVTGPPTYCVVNSRTS